MREIKFRAWDGKKMLYTDHGDIGRTGTDEFEWSPYCFVIPWPQVNGIPEVSKWPVMQYTGLKDKKEPKTCIYEGDIVSLSGQTIGNKHENPELLEDQTNLLIEGFGTKSWITTHQKAVDRGCTNSE